jgi:formylglycine-generating enzyme
MRAGFFIGLLLQACGGTTHNSGAVPASGGSYGWSYTTGRPCGDGGALVAAVDAATKCAGNLETVEACTGMCVTNLVTISGPNRSYGIDATEVTQGQYSAWLATNPTLPPSTDKSCGALTSYAQHGAGYTGSDPDQYPVVYVDWCSAYAYCLAVGKRLCGAIDGGSNADERYADANTSQWYRACSSGGMNTYPYGNSYQGNVCAGVDARTALVAVASLTDCMTSEAGYAGVYDLSGNVSEWEDSCYSSQDWTYCHLRGGSFKDPGNFLTCDTGGYGLSGYTFGNVGFRCCSI